MKNLKLMTLSLLCVSALLVGCGNKTEEKPAEAQTVEQTADQVKEATDATADAATAKTEEAKDAVNEAKDAVKEAANGCSCKSKSSS